VQKLANIPALKFAILFIVGILTGSAVHFNKIILIFLIILSSFILIYNYFKNKGNHPSYLAIFFLIILSGIFKAQIDFHTSEINSIANYNCSDESNELILKGYVKDFPDADTDRIKFILDCTQLISKDTSNVEGYVLVTIKKNKYSKSETKPPELSPGNEVLLEGRITEPPENRNPGEFNYKKYLFLQNIHKSFFVFGFENIEVLSDDNAYSLFTELIQNAKKYSVDNILENNPGDNGAFLLGLVAGERSKITREMKDDFVNAGVMHLIAVSGLNVAYVILSVLLILSLFRIPQTSKIIIAILLIILYCIFTGSAASIMRASVMGILVLLYSIIERKKEYYNIIGISIIVILIFDSKQLLDAGFILSYTAVLSMVFVYEKLDKLFIQKILNRDFRGKKITSILIILFVTTLAAQIGTIPLTAIYFEKISLISLFANMFAVPLSNISLALGFLQIILSLFSDFISSAIAETNNLLLYIQLAFIKWCASIDFSYIKFYKFNLIAAIGYYLILILILTIKNLKFIFYRIILVISIIVAIFIINFEYDDKLIISFIDVGQGDCTLIQVPGDKCILIDTGPVTENFNPAERNIIPYLSRQGINKIDLLIVSHLHNDHIGGISKLIDNIKVERIAEVGQKTKNYAREKIDSIIIANKIIRDFTETGDILEGFNNLKIYFLFPNKQYLQNRNFYNDENNLNLTSLVFKIKYGNTEILFTSDIEKEQEDILCEYYDDFLKSDILKVPHHGSKSSSSIPFLLRVKPDYSVICCGLYNSYKNPASIVLNRLKNINSEIFRTDIDGAVIFESDGENINPIKWR